MFSCFQLTPPPAVLCILGTRSQGSHQGEWGRLVGAPLVVGPGASGLDADPLALPRPFGGRRGRRPHIPREGWGRPQRPLGRKSGEREVARRPVPLGPTHVPPRTPPKNNPFLLSGNILLRDLHHPPWELLRPSPQEMFAHQGGDSSCGAEAPAKRVSPALLTYTELLSHPLPAMERAFPRLSFFTCKTARPPVPLPPRGCWALPSSSPSAQSPKGSFGTSEC